VIAWCNDCNDRPSRSDRSPQKSAPADVPQAASLAAVAPSGANEAAPSPAKQASLLGKTRKNLGQTSRVQPSIEPGWNHRMYRSTR